jgi:phage gp46-like protein
MSTVHDERYTPEYLGFCEMRARQYLRELDNPFEEWVYGYHPDKIEREINTILMADAGNEFALKVKERLPSLRRECETKYILFRTKQRSDRAEAAVTVAAKQRYAKEALQLLEDGIRAGVADADKLRALIPQTSQYIAHVAIEDSIEKAKRFEFKENKKKALEYYRDALYSALNDHIDNDQQREVMDWLRAKIDDLEKGVALEMAGRKVAKRKQKSVDQPYQKP